METLEAIATRHGVGRVKPDRPPRALIEQLLAAAIHAPNHFLTQPWRFVVVAGDSRVELGHAMAAALRARLPEPNTAESQTQLSREAAKPLRAPVVIAVAVEPSSDPRAVEIEEIEAGAAAVENLLLAAHALGLGAQWRTGDAAYDPAVKQSLGFGERTHVVGFVYVGYPESAGQPTARASAEAKTRWLGW